MWPNRLFWSKKTIFLEFSACVRGQHAHAYATNFHWLAFYKTQRRHKPDTIMPRRVARLTCSSHDRVLSFWALGKLSWDLQGKRHALGTIVSFVVILARSCQGRVQSWPFRPQTLCFKSQPASATTFYFKLFVMTPGLTSLPPLFIAEIFVVFSSDFDWVHLVAPLSCSSTLVSR